MWVFKLNWNPLFNSLMRRRHDSPNGIMDYLFIKLFAYNKVQGFGSFSLGLTQEYWFSPDRWRRFMRVTLELVEEIQRLQRAGTGDHHPLTEVDGGSAQRETGVEVS